MCKGSDFARAIFAVWKNSGPETSGWAIFESRVPDQVFPRSTNATGLALDHVAAQAHDAYRDYHNGSNRKRCLRVVVGSLVDIIPD